LLAGIDGESGIALEATCGWACPADLLQDAGYELHLAHPLRTKAIFIVDRKGATSLGRSVPVG
jgi:hypothetical protein